MIVLVHSGICDARMWDGFELPGAVRHELRGLGANPLPPAGEFSHADDLEDALAGERAALVGASFGGLVCLELAAPVPSSSASWCCSTLPCQTTAGRPRSGATANTRRS